MASRFKIGVLFVEGVILVCRSKSFSGLDITRQTKEAEKWQSSIIFHRGIDSNKIGVWEYRIPSSPVWLFLTFCLAMNTHAPPKKKKERLKERVYYRTRLSGVSPSINRPTSSKPLGPRPRLRVHFLNKRFQGLGHLRRDQGGLWEHRGDVLAWGHGLNFRSRLSSLIFHM